jgi:hypothetical protein
MEAILSGCRRSKLVSCVPRNGGGPSSPSGVNLLRKMITESLVFRYLGSWMETLSSRVEPG